MEDGVLAGAQVDMARPRAQLRISPGSGPSSSLRGAAPAHGRARRTIEPAAAGCARSAQAAFWLLLLTACSSAGTPSDAGVSEAGPADAAGADALAPDGGPPPTCLDAPVTRSIGPEGGVLTLCGGTLTVPAGALAAPIAFGIAPAAVPIPAPWAPRTLAGPALHFTPDDALLPARVDVALPHGGGSARFELYAVVDGELVGVEPCAIDGATVGQTVGLLGTFVATRDDYPYPELSTAGEGTIAATFGATTVSFRVPTDGFAIDSAYASVVTLQTEVHLLDDVLGFRRFRFFADVDPATREGALSFAEWYVQSEGGVFWTLGTPAAPGSTGLVRIDAVDGATLQGQVSGTLFSGTETVAFSADFDLTPVYFQYPIELVCEGG